MRFSCYKRGGFWGLTGVWAVLDEEGKLVDGATDPELGRDLCTEIYSGMLRLNVSLLAGNCRAVVC